MKLVRHKDELHLYMRYHPFCSELFRRDLSGQWRDGKWVFPETFKPELQKTLMRHFGEDGEKPCERVDVLIKGNIDHLLYMDKFYNVCFLGKVLFKMRPDKKGADPRKGSLEIGRDFKVYGYKRRPEKGDFEVFQDLFRCEGFRVSNVAKPLADDLVRENEKTWYGIEIKIEN